MVALIERAQGHQLDGDSHGESPRESEQHAQRIRPGGLVEIGGEVCPHHVERTVREVHQVHDAEDEREARRHQEQHHPELQPVESLLEQENEIHENRGQTTFLSSP